MRSELSAGPQPLQVLHVSEQEEHVLALRVGLKQPVAKTTKPLVILVFLPDQNTAPPPGFPSKRDVTPRVTQPQPSIVVM